MKHLLHADRFLLPFKYRKYGMIMLFSGIPIMLLFFSLIVFNLDSNEFKTYWDTWGGYVLHIPLSMGFFWMLFASEKEEDEMFMTMRLKAMFHGVRFTFIAILMLPLLYNIKRIIFGNAWVYPEIGGNLAIVTLMLAYSYGAYWFIKRTSLQDEIEHDNNDTQRHEY